MFFPLPRQRSQEELKLLTSESLQRVVSAQEELLTRQETLRGGQAEMEDSLSSNLEHLVQEKALIASGQQQVAELLEGITRRMGERARRSEDSPPGHLQPSSG